MLSSQQRILLGVARRKVLHRNTVLLNGPKEHVVNPLVATASSSLSFHTGTSSRRKSKDSTKVSGLPSPIQPFTSNNALFHTAVLERAYPFGMARTPIGMSFSTTTKDEEEKPSYRKRASEYGDKAKAGAQSFGGMMQTYGPTFVGTYLGVYVTNLALFYVGIQSGALDPVTMLGYITGNHDEVRTSAEVVSELLEHYTVTAPFAETVRAKPHLANFSIAWISTKFTEPIRFGLSVAIVPRVARYLGTVPQKKEDNVEKVDDIAAVEPKKEEDTATTTHDEKKP